MYLTNIDLCGLYQGKYVGKPLPPQTNPNFQDVIFVLKTLHGFLIFGLIYTIVWELLTINLR